MRFGLAPDFDAQSEEDPMIPVEDAQIAHLELLSYRYRLERWRQAHTESPRHYDDQVEPATDEEQMMMMAIDLPPMSLPSTTASSSTDSLLATPLGEWWEPLRLKECKGAAALESREIKKWGPGPGQSFGPGPRTMAASENLKESRKRLREDEPKEERHNSLGLSLVGEEETFTFKRRCSSERSMSSSLSSFSSKRSSKGFIKPSGRVSSSR